MAADRIVFISGFSGSGKSVTGRLLARRLGWRFVDIDELIEQSERTTIPELFARRGERIFRNVEQKAIHRVVKSSRGPRVVALGGGALESAAVRKQVLAAGTLVYLSCSVREIYRRVKGLKNRPLLEIPAGRSLTPRQARLSRVRTLLNKRLPNYRRADIILSTTNRTPAQAARELERLIHKHYGFD